MTARDRWGAAALAGLAVAAYLRLATAGYVWDDDRHVTYNPALGSLSGLRAVWTTLDATPQYYPLTHTVFWVEHALWGLDPRGYHAVNVLLHAASAVLLWRILTMLRLPGAWVAAAIFAVHPVHVESVAWVSELKNVLSGCFYLAAAKVFLGWALGEDRGAWRPGLAAALYGAALLSKTVTSTWPVVMALTLWWKTGRVSRRQIAWLAPMLALGAIFGGITHHLERTQIGASGADWALSPAARFALAGHIVWFYLGKLAWPHPLVFVYPRWTVDPGAAAAWGGTAAALALAAGLFVYRGKLGRGPCVAFAMFVVTLAPALGFFNVYPMRYSFVADHFQYLASIGPIALAAALGARWARGPGRRSAQAALAAGVIVALAGGTWARTGAYHDEETLWRDTIAQNPGAWIAHNDLGILLAERGQNAEATAEFERVLALRPDHSGARANLGYLQEIMGHPADAAMTLAAAAAERPDDADVRIHLVHVLIGSGRFEEAIDPALEAARLRPDDADVLCDAGTLLARGGRPREAIPLLTRALTLQPGLARAAANLELARRALGDVRYPQPK